MIPSWLRLTSILNCNMGKMFFFFFLRIWVSLLEVISRRLAFWDPVLHTIKFRLSGVEKLFSIVRGPLKVSILVWRLLRDRLRSKVNLLNNDIISADATSCTAGCGQAESAHHLFLHCDTYGSLWQHVRYWIGVPGVDHQSLRAHFLHFTHYLGGLSARRFFLKLLWLLCVWLV